MALYITQKNRGAEEFNPNCTKRATILDLDPQKIKDYAEDVCIAISRAMLFFQNRCGIRSISDINYKAQLTVIAYFFMDDKYFRDEKIHFFFEYWYWISIFGYLYPSNQDIEIYKTIPEFELYFSNRKKHEAILTKLQSYQKDVLNKEDYSDMETLIIGKNRRKNPPAVMSKYICQYYLALGYYDFWDDSNYIWFLNQEPFDVHHIMPLGSDPDFRVKKIALGETTKEVRKDKGSQYNSPLNMLYITKKSNKRISDMDYQTYSQTKEVMSVIGNLGCITTFTENTDINEFLIERYKKLYSSLEQRLKDLLGCLRR